MKRSLMEDQSVEQAIRRAHCSHDKRDDPDHGCAGKCTITAKGVTLECSLCGDDFRERHPLRAEAGERARSIVEAAGVKWTALSDEARQKAAREVERTMCPSCGSEKPATYHAREHHKCPCGDMVWSSWSGWRGADA